MPTTSEFPVLLENFTKWLFEYLEAEDYKRVDDLWDYFKRELKRRFGEEDGQNKITETQEHVGYKAGYMGNHIQSRAWNQIGAYHPWLGPPVHRPGCFKDPDFVLQLGMAMGELTGAGHDPKKTLLYYNNRADEQQLIEVLYNYKDTGALPIVFKNIEGFEYSPTVVSSEKATKEKLEIFQKTLKIK